MKIENTHHKTRNTAIIYYNNKFKPAITKMLMKKLLYQMTI